LSVESIPTQNNISLNVGNVVVVRCYVVHSARSLSVFVMS